MKFRTALAVAVALTTVAVAGLTVALGGGTFASLSDAESSTPSRAGAASVLLGSGSGPDLGYEGLVPGTPQRVDLRIDYEGSVAAELALSITPDGDSAFCEQRNGDWVARPGVPVTVTVGSAPPVSYCSLYEGGPIPLGAVQPNTPRNVDVVITLAADAGPGSAGLEELDTATVRADGGFTDDAAGHLKATTAATPGPAIGGAPLAVAPAALAVQVADPEAADTVVLDAADPATSARTIPAGQGITLPAECVAAGMTALDFVEVIALDPAAPVWDAVVSRGRGSGPFLVLGTSTADRITGSDGGDCIVGGDGADQVAGGDGNDVIVGGVGDDVLRGDVGVDRLAGDAGRDDLVGGEGVDILAGGGDGATCDAAPGESAVGCQAPSVPAAAPAPVPGNAVTPLPGPAPGPAQAPVPAPAQASEPAPAPEPPPEPLPEPKTAPEPASGSEPAVAPDREPVPEISPPAPAPIPEDPDPAAEADPQGEAGRSAGAPPTSASTDATDL